MWQSPPADHRLNRTAALPSPLTRLVGREEVVAQVVVLLGTARLVTLTGSGGVGKTRVALAATQAAEAEAAWVDLTPLAEPTLVPQMVAVSVGAFETPGQPLIESVIAALRDRRLLLVIDNAEHLIEAVARLVEQLLMRCPALAVLATCREPLAISGEIVWRVPSLAVPDPRCRVAPEALAAVPAVALFLERAQAADPTFTPTVNLAAEAEICRRLDGIPLALELAAARVRMLTPAEIVARLDDRFRLLSGGHRTAPSRHQSLRATLDWSHSLLTEAEQTLFRRLAVFAGDWSLPAAEAVCADDGLPADVVLDRLARLIDHSLIQAQAGPAGATRYRLLETVRQYAAERLQAAGELVAVQRRHADYCLTLAGQTEQVVPDDDQATWLTRLEAEYDDLRLALAWWVANDPVVGLRLARRLGRLWLVRSYFSEGLRWLERLLELAPDPTSERAEALPLASFLARLLEDTARSRPWSEEGLALSMAIGEPRLVAAASCEVGAVCLFSGDHERAGALLETGVELGRTAGSPESLGMSLFFLGRLADTRGEYARARTLLEESLALGLSATVMNEAGTTSVRLGQVALCQGDDGRAEDLITAGLTRARRVGSSQIEALAWHAQGQVAAWRGDLVAARRWYERSMLMLRSLGGSGAAAAIALAAVLRQQGELAEAKTLLDRVMVLPSLDLRQHDVLALLLNRGLLFWELGDATQAAKDLCQGLALCHKLGYRLGIAECLEALAHVGAHTDRPAQAARLLGVAAALRASIGAPLPPVDQPAVDAIIEQAQAVLGRAGFAAASAAGAALPLERAIAEALETAEIAPTAEARASAPSPAAPAGITRREAEVLRLLAAGRSNREIGSALALSARTIERHIANIYLKIDGHNRADATAFAFRHGLLTAPEASPT